MTNDEHSLRILVYQLSFSETQTDQYNLPNLPKFPAEFGELS